MRGRCILWSMAPTFTARSSSSSGGQDTCGMHNRRLSFSTGVAIFRCSSSVLVMKRNTTRELKICSSSVSLYTSWFWTRRLAPADSMPVGAGVRRRRDCLPMASAATGYAQPGTPNRVRTGTALQATMHKLQAPEPRTHLINY